MEVGRKTRVGCSACYPCFFAWLMNSWFELPENGHKILNVAGPSPVIGTARPRRCFSLNRCPRDINSTVFPDCTKNIRVQWRKIGIIVMILQILGPIPKANGRKGNWCQAFEICRLVNQVRQMTHGGNVFLDSISELVGSIGLKGYPYFKGLQIPRKLKAVFHALATSITIGQFAQKCAIVYLWWRLLGHQISCLGVTTRAPKLPRRTKLVLPWFL